MALSNAHKDYWVRELKNELNGQIEALLIEAGQIDLIFDARLLARAQLTESYGISDLVEEYDRLNMLRQHHSKEETRYRELANEKSYEIKRKLDNSQSKLASNHYYSWDAFLDERAKQILNDVLVANYGELGQRIADLRNAIDKVERTIMLATSQTQLQEFLNKFAEHFGVSLGGDLL